MSDFFVVANHHDHDDVGIATSDGVGLSNTWKIGKTWGEVGNCVSFGLHENECVDHDVTLAVGFTNGQDRSRVDVATNRRSAEVVGALLAHKLSSTRDVAQADSRSDSTVGAFGVQA